MSKYLITGGAGFIGSHLAEALLADGRRVLILDNLSTGKKSNIPKGAEFHKIDIRNLEKIRPFFNGVDGVFHLAAIPSVPYSVEHPVESFRVNVDGTLHVLSSAKDAGVKRVVFSSSAAVYGSEKKLPHRPEMVPQPMNPYALHKVIGEALMKQFASLYDLETVSLRYFNAYGPRMADVGAYVTVISIFAQLKKAGKALSIHGDGKQTRDFVHVRDIARANILAMQSKKVGK
ncbi:MAG: NAD-dependent epimerase/dehydratase family protein, partial [bacterium]|nr:NAD-dependent epimerase/dehydratase family protein [bacterium]